MAIREEDPTLKTTMKPLTGAAPKSKSETTAGNGEDTTTVTPQTEEESAESPEVETTEGEGAESQEDDKEKKPEVEEYEIFLEGEEEEQEVLPKDEASRNHAFTKARLAEKEAKAEAARLKRELEALRAPAGVPDPGPEPTSEDCAYDEAELKRRYLKWNQDKAAFEEHAAKKAQQEQVQRQEAQNKLTAFGTARTDLMKRVPGYVDAEAVVARTMTADRQEVLLKYAENPARVVYFLGRNPERLGEFAGETDIGRFIAKLAKLEVGMKERKRTQAPAPEQSPRGSGAVNSADSTLEKLRAKAQKTGDYAEVNKYKRDLKRKRDQRK